MEGREGIFAGPTATVALSRGSSTADGIDSCARDFLSFFQSIPIYASCSNVAENNKRCVDTDGKN